MCLDKLRSISFSNQRTLTKCLLDEASIMKLLILRCCILSGRFQQHTSASGVVIEEIGDIPDRAMNGEPA